jgi:ribosome-binding factor A
MADRMDRVNELLRQELSHLVEESLPRGKGLVTVTDVETTRDLKYATVHISIYGRNRKRVLDILGKKSPRFFEVLSRRLRMKYIPQLTFMVNDEARKERIEKLLDQL